MIDKQQNSKSLGDPPGIWRDIDENYAKVWYYDLISNISFGKRLAFDVVKWAFVGQIAIAGIFVHSSLCQIGKFPIFLISIFIGTIMIMIYIFNILNIKAQRTKLHRLRAHIGGLAAALAEPDGSPLSGRSQANLELALGFSIALVTGVAALAEFYVPGC